jgi:hypothetical protein
MNAVGFGSVVYTPHGFLFIARDKYSVFTFVASLMQLPQT